MHATTPALAEGEIHVATIQIAGQAPYLLVLLPGEAEDVTHAGAQEWAASIGGELPNRHEQALMHANLEDQFQNAWYWSDQQHESDPDYVWCQLFSHGNQNGYRRDVKLRARAVRRLPI